METFGSVSVKTSKVDADVISFLPLDVLTDILSLLPTKLAVSTSLLSKNWSKLYTLVHNLDFDNSLLLQPENGKLERDDIKQSFRNFVDTTLASHCGLPIKKFSLKCLIDEEDNEMMAYVNRWLCNVVNRVVLEIDLVMAYIACSLPSQLFVSKTLVKLKLGAKISLEKLPSDVSLPALKSLFLDAVFFECDDLSYVLLPGCTALEELYISHKDFQGTPYFISSRTIKRLSVHYDFEFGIDNMSGMAFKVPSLVFLDYSDYALTEYAQVDFASLLEARLDLRYTSQVVWPDVRDLIYGIKNIQTLHLSPDSAHVISLCCENGLVLPVFDNLVSLSYGSKNKRGWKLLQLLLDKYPKLETLTIQGLEGYGGEVNMNRYQVKVLRILGY